jgi:hypothetical protein
MGTEKYKQDRDKLTFRELGSNDNDFEEEYSDDESNEDLSKEFE